MLASTENAMMPARDAFDSAGYRAERRCAAAVNAAVRGAIWLAVLLCLCLAGSNPLFAQQERKRDTGVVAGVAKEAKTRPWARSSVTHHVIEIRGRRLAYTARAGMVDVTGTDAKTRGRIFFVAYTEDGANPRSRPLTFAFNGGPGAASAYLHLLALGPRMVALKDDGSIPSPPVHLVNNPATWLDFTDLVFVDPVGTGYSRAISPEKGKDAKQKPGAGDASHFWNVNADLDSLAEFIRLYLTGTQRWASPKFLAGESYGAFRAAILPNRMTSKPGVRLNGVVLISPVFEFSLRRFNAYRLLPWASMLPAYAATALYHHKSSVAGKLPDVLSETEGFAMGGYLTWLARQKPSDNDPVVQKLSAYLGLSRDMILRHHGRISRTVFAKNLLRDSGRVVSPYDGTITEVDPHPDSPFLEGDDPVLNGLSAPLTAAFNEYVRSELDFETQRPYRVLNPTTSRKWRWETDGHFQRIGAANDLKEAMSLNPNLKVLIAHGAYDMVTPYLASKYVVRHMALDPSIASNVTFKVYDGGHMPYTHAAVRAALHQDTRTFFHDALKGAN